MFLPSLLILAWLFLLLRHWLTLNLGLLLGLAIILVAVMLSVVCVVWVRWQAKDEKEP
jgi:chromate transport protein ChrA